MFQMNSSGPEDSQLSYRQQVIRVLVQRYIESARREFEETKRKGKGQKCTIPNVRCNMHYCDWSLLLLLRYRQSDHRAEQSGLQDA